MSNGPQVRPRRRPGEQLQAFDGVGDANQARRQSWTGSRGLSARQQVWQPSLHKVHKYNNKIQNELFGEIVEEGGEQIWRDQGFIFSTPICLILRGAKGVAITQHKSNPSDQQAKCFLNFLFLWRHYVSDTFFLINLQVVDTFQLWQNAPCLGELIVFNAIF